jgi:hypothetical protein
VADGCAAGADLIATVYENMTVSPVIAKYAPSEDNNDPDNYNQFIGGWAWITPTTFIRDFPPAKFFDLSEAISRLEEWVPQKAL